MGGGGREGATAASCTGARMGKPRVIWMKRQETMRGRSAQNGTEHRGGEEVFWWLGGRRNLGGLEERKRREDGWKQPRNQIRHSGGVGRKGEKRNGGAGRVGGEPKGEWYGGVIIFTSGSSRKQRTSRLLDSFKNSRGRIALSSVPLPSSRPVASREKSMISVESV